MDGDGSDTLLRKETRHELRVPLGAAEADTLLPAACQVLFQGIAGARIGRHRRLQRFQIEVSASPWNVRIIDIIRHPEIVEWAE